MIRIAIDHGYTLPRFGCRASLAGTECCDGYHAACVNGLLERLYGVAGILFARCSWIWIPEHARYCGTNDQSARLFKKGST